VRCTTNIEIVPIHSDFALGAVETLLAAPDKRPLTQSTAAIATNTLF